MMGMVVYVVTLGHYQSIWRGYLISIPGCGSYDGEREDYHR
jgi:hypothetical protein